MIFTQVTLLIETTVKKPNGAEKATTQPIVLPAKSERVSQTRIDEFSMQGLTKRYRWTLDNIGELEYLNFMYFLDEKGTKYKTTTWERNVKNDNVVLEGIVANGI